MSLFFAFTRAVSSLGLVYGVGYERFEIDPAILSMSADSTIWLAATTATIALQDASAFGISVTPGLRIISFRTLRHFKATMEYHRTKDILHVMQLLGHKSIKNTLVYTHLISFESDDYVCKVAKTVDEAKTLVESGFEYVTDVDGTKLFRKRK